MNILTVADGHGHFYEEAVRIEAMGKPVPDIILFLGDNDYYDLDAVVNAFPKVPKFGVLGNHDMILDGKPTVLDEAGIPNIHLKTVECNGIIIGGFEGSIRYKDSTCYPLYTGGESVELLADFLYCDLFITHSPPQFFEPDNITSHTGLLGIGKYVREKRPQVHLYGHLHQPESSMYMATAERCCYGIEWHKFLFTNEKR